MPGWLRYMDPPQVAGLLYPTEIVLPGAPPSSYTWAEDLYRVSEARTAFGVSRGESTREPGHYPAERHWVRMPQPCGTVC